MERQVLLACLVGLSLSSAIPSDPLSDKDHFRGEEHDAKYDHEQFLGKDQAASYDQLTPEQSKERLGKLVPVIDKNADDAITEEELKDHINFMQKRFPITDSVVEEY